MIDLHVHTNASDGTMSPTELVRYAKKKKLKAIAVTDHDTVEGVQEALDAGALENFEVIPGIEISAEAPQGTLHILGYCIDYTDKAFLDTISILQKAREERNPRIITKLQELGLSIEFQEVVEQAETGQVGRPHFAQVLVQKGYVKTPREAFDRYLKRGAPAYVEKFRFQPAEAIAAIRKAGGIPVLAHPVTLEYKKSAELEDFVKELIHLGLMGIEVLYPEHNRSLTKQYTALAEKHRMLITGGSDFHGFNIKGLDIGTGKGGLRVLDALLKPLKAAAESL